MFTKKELEIIAAALQEAINSYEMTERDTKVELKETVEFKQVLKKIIK